MLDKEITNALKENSIFKASLYYPFLKGFTIKAIISDRGDVGGYLINNNKNLHKLSWEISKLLDEISFKHVIFRSPPKEWGVNMRHSFNNIISLENGVIIIIGDNEEYFRGVDLSFVNNESILSRARRK